MEKGEPELGLGHGEGDEGKAERELLGLGQGGEERGEGILAPWEQHAAVISIPRFDYRAPFSLLERSLSGFLVTCPIKREKSATKEAMSILEKYVDSICGSVLDANASIKRRKLCIDEIDANVEGIQKKSANDILEALEPDEEKETSLASLEADGNANKSLVLSLVKLTRSGLLLFTFPSNEFHHTVDTVSTIFHSLECESLKPPLWCHRIFPIQETCNLTENDLKIVVSKLVQGFLRNEKDIPERSIKFAVAYNRRGIDETEMKIQKHTLKSSEKLTLLDRDVCFKVVAGAVKAVAENSVVDLKSPEIAVCVELLPVSGVSHGSLVAGVSVLPHGLFVTKPRLCVKPLVSDSKATKRRG